MSHLFLTTVNFALGNWVNTPTAPNDENSPPPVGNEGRFTVRSEDKEWQFDVHRAKLLEGGTLEICGEPWGQKHQFRLKFSMPEDWQKLDDSGRGIPKLCNSCGSEGSCYLDLDGQQISVNGGHIELTSVTGSGPWEVDGQATLNTEDQHLTGVFQIQVS